jgi:uncharacterized membrane protein YqiK
MLWLGIVAGSIAFVLLLVLYASVRYIPNTKVGVVEKLWSNKGSLGEGKIIALNGEAGYQSNLLRGGIHFGLWRWQYAVNKVPLVMIKQGKIGYVFARDGGSLQPNQTLAQVVESNNFQDARAFLGNHGQRGRQRAILREGVYAINLAMFSVITENEVLTLRRDSDSEGWRKGLKDLDGFDPILVGEITNSNGNRVDSIGIVTVQDGPALENGDIIAPAVLDHNNFQDPEAFIAAGGQRGLQYATLIDGTYFINRWFATVKYVPKTVVPIGHVGVIVSYFGKAGLDQSGAGFRHGEQVGENERGVRAIPLGPGKYPFNPYAGNIVMVPTTNFVLHWITGKSEGHRYDDSLKSIELVTKDAYEPSLPLSVVVHIDYQKAPSVIQRFGDVKQLITQTLDPLLSAFFRDVAHKKTMLDLIHSRDDIQKQARESLQGRFAEFDIQCVDVLIGKPDSDNDNGKIENLLEQLRQRQLSEEQVATYEKQKTAAGKEQELKQAQALAASQTQLTVSKVEIEIVRNKADANLEKVRKEAEQTVVLADAELQRSHKQAQTTVVLAEANAKQAKLEGEGNASRVSQVGLAEADVLQKKVAAAGSPQLYALSQVAFVVANGKHPLVPEHLIVQGGEGGNQANSLGLLLNLLVAEKTGFEIAPTTLQGGVPLNGDGPILIRQTAEPATNGSAIHGGGRD